MTTAGDPEEADVSTRDVEPTRDRVPRWLRDADLRLEAMLPSNGRQRAAVAIGLLAAMVGIVVASLRLLVLVADVFDILAYTGLFVTNWVANGGLLVPVPGLRIVGWLMIIHQGGALDALVAGVVGGIAMALGQTSLYITTASAREGAARHPVRLPSRVRSMASGQRAQTARAKLERLLRDHGFVTIVGVSFVPTPVTSVATGMAAAMGFGFRRFVLGALVGRIAFGLVLAYLGDAILGVVHRA
jgi:hypothetical protein